MTFDSTSVNYAESGEVWDPRVPRVIRIGSSCQLNLRLGCRIEIPANLPPGTYIAYFLAIVSYVGDYGTMSAAYTEVGFFTVRVTTDAHPASFKLFQNYPNPFNNSTMIKYHLSQPGELSMEVFNLVGQSIATLAEGFEYAGEKTLSWNAASLPSGVYYVRMRTPRTIHTRKMLYVR